MCVPVPKELPSVLRKRMIEAALDANSLKDAQKKRFLAVTRIFADFQYLGRSWAG